jgi:hypothetical protein
MRILLASRMPLCYTEVMRKAKTATASAAAAAVAYEPEIAAEGEDFLNQATQEDIAARAYQLWQERGCPEGSPEVDWLAAEAELLG